LINYVINQFLFRFYPSCSSFVPISKIDWNTQVLDYIKKKRVCSVVPAFLRVGQGKVFQTVREKVCSAVYQLTILPTVLSQKLWNNGTNAPFFTSSY